MKNKIILAGVLIVLPFIVFAQTTDTNQLQQLIASLQNQVAILQAQLNGTQGTTTSTLNLLIVTKSGAGSGVVSSTPAGINCGNDCSEAYASGTFVQLFASANPGSVFGGWNCGGTTTSTYCGIAMSSNRIVTALFNSAATSTVSAISPNGGENWTIGQTYEISWTRTGIFSTSTTGQAVWLLKGGRIVYNPCGSNPPNLPDSCNWTIPTSTNNPDLQGGTDYRIRIVVFDQPTGLRLAADDSNANFSINPSNNPPYITSVTGPTTLLKNMTGTWQVSATDQNGNLSNLNISWGDNTASTTVSLNGSSTTQSISHSYSTTGIKTITFRVSDASGLSDTEITTVNVRSVVPSLNKIPIEGALIKSAEEQLAQMTVKLYELMRQLGF